MTALQPLTGLDRAALLALNNAAAVELSWLEPARFEQLLGWASYARGVAPAAAMLLGFDQDAGYDGLNFAWFRARYPRFLYVDRIVVAPEARGRGLARLLYADLFAFAASTGHTLIACEINAVPPNPASDRFHAAHGFAPVGESAAEASGRVVRYMLHRLRGSVA